jgi:BirA family biotin operon repressor/biotin-[acetyl-CoA-carboxylase] ligase
MGRRILGVVSGDASTAPGEASTAPGEASTAPGEASTAPGEASSAPGEASTAPGEASTAPSVEAWGRFRILRFDQLDSTNRLVREAASAGEPHGLVVVADHQTGGRGRLGRTWEDQPGTSLLVSVLVRPAPPTDRAGLATLAAGLAVAEALEHGAGVDAALKWPNDVVVGDRKLAGVLAEWVGGTDGDAVVIGVGANLGQAAFAGPLADTATSCRLLTGTAPDRDEVLRAFLDTLGAHLDALDDVVERARPRMTTVGRDVRVELADRVVVGRARSIDARGALVVTDDQGRETVISAGDVTHLRPA